jgi:hypothetical protein
MSSPFEARVGGDETLISKKSVLIVSISFWKLPPKQTEPFATKFFLDCNSINGWHLKELKVSDTTVKASKTYARAKHSSVVTKIYIFRMGKRYPLDREG